MTAAKLAFAIARTTIIVCGRVTGTGTSMATARKILVVQLFTGRVASCRVITGEDTGETWIDASFVLAS